MEAHREAVTAVLGVIEDRFLHTRVGHAGCAQVATRGMLAAAFDHWDTRTGDPNLHTHVVIANKVQGPDGKWRSIDGQVIFRAAVALSEVYDDLVADAIAARLPVTWSWRDRGARRTPAFEIDGLSDDLLAVFSTRSGQIAAVMQTLIAEFRDRHDRDPNRREILRLRQQATLATRPDKTVRPLGELFGRWRATANALTGQSPEQILAAVLHPQQPGAEPEVELLATTVLAGVVERRSTWTRANLLAEAARASRHLRLPDPAARIALLDRIVDAALAQCVALDPPEPFDTPHRFRRSDGVSGFTRPDEHAFTTAAVLAAEDRLVAATGSPDAPRVEPDTLAPVLAAVAVGMPGARGLTQDQIGAVEQIAGSGRLLDVLSARPVPARLAPCARYGPRGRTPTAPAASWASRRRRLPRRNWPHPLALGARTPPSGSARPSDAPATRGGPGAPGSSSSSTRHPWSPPTTSTGSSPKHATQERRSSWSGTTTSSTPSAPVERSLCSPKPSTRRPSPAANHAWVAVDSPDGTCPNPGEPTVTGRQVLEAVLTTDGAELSATATLRRWEDHATSLRRLLPIRELLDRAPEDPAAVEAISRIDAIVRDRAAERAGRPATSPTPALPDQEGLRR